jgi:hypothetical protein
MGAATALYSATCFAHGKYGNGNPYPVNLSLAVGLSGWLPCARFVCRCRCGMRMYFSETAAISLMCTYFFGSTQDLEEQN